MSSIPIGDSGFSLSHTCDMVNISSFNAALFALHIPRIPENKLGKRLQIFFFVLIEKER